MTPTGRSGWGSQGFPPSSPRRPPPPGGRRAPEGARRGSRGFTSTWWGTAWIEALEQRARLDPNRLPRGRTYARAGHVLSMDLEAGMISASVSGSRSTPYTVDIRVRTFGDDEWERVIDAIASRAGHAAALLDGELDPGVVDDARSAGTELLPDAGDLQPRCSCPDWADPCKHAAAVCYLVAPVLDEDPFELFALRGRSRSALLAAVRQRRVGAGSAGSEGGGDSGGGARGADGSGGDVADPDDGEALAASTWVWESDPGVVARQVWAEHTDGDLDLPPLRAAPHRPGTPAPWPTDPPRELGVSAVALRALATDAAERAFAMVRSGAPSGLALDAEVDLARRAASAMGTDRWEALVARSSLADRDLAAMAIAYESGGAAGVAVIDEPAWTPPQEEIDSTREALVVSGAPPRSVRVTQNRVTVSPWRAQLRISLDGRWWGFAKRGNRWQLATSGHDDIDDAVEALLAVVG